MLTRLQSFAPGRKHQKGIFQEAGSLLTSLMRGGAIIPLLIVALSSVGSITTAQSSAPDILVSTTSDASDFGGAQQVADLPGPDGVVSLREAISAANNTPGPQVIGFAIPISDPGFDATVFSIRPLLPLPALVDNGTTIDGATQSTFTGNTNPAGPEIVLNGDLSGCTSGLVIISANNVVRSLVINGFSGVPNVCLPAGIGISGPQATGNIVAGCLIGLDASGTAIVSNAHGVNTDDGATNNRIGGASGAERNVISGNGIRGITLSSGNNSVLGNFIGTDVTGTVAIGNGEQDGVEVSVSGRNNLIEKNIISANRSGVRLQKSGGNVVRGNFLGTDVTGMLALGNREDGVIVDGDDNSIVGNLVSANALDGISIFSPDNNLASGNQIGTDIQGNPTLGNGRFGVHINSANVIPSTPNGNRIEDNTIAGSGSAGVGIFGGTRNSVRRNRIFSNGGLGIQICNCPNDPGDFDTGPNELMNFPVLERAHATPGRLVLKGIIDTQDARAVTIEFFANPVPTPGGDPSGHGEGAIFLGTARPNPHGEFTASLPAVAVGTLISATATDADGNTSEFAANIVTFN